MSVHPSATLVIHAQTVQDIETLPPAADDFDRPTSLQASFQELARSLVRRSLTVAEPRLRPHYLSPNLRNSELA